MIVNNSDNDLLFISQVLFKENREFLLSDNSWKKLSEFRRELLDKRLISEKENRHIAVFLVYLLDSVDESGGKLNSSTIKGLDIFRRSLFKREWIDSSENGDISQFLNCLSEFVGI